MTARPDSCGQRRVVDAEHARRAAAHAGYSLRRRLGSGGFGDVYRAWDRELCRLVAIKVLPAGESGDHAQSLAGARAQAKFNNAHIVSVHRSQEELGLYLMDMEYMDGGTVSTSYPRPGQETACAIALAIAYALSYVHHQRLLHLDIKPDNILVHDVDGVWRPKLTDFGVSRKLGKARIVADHPRGMRTFLAPEQLSGGVLSPATDVCALGLVLYELLARRPAHPSSHGARQAMDEALPLPPTVSSDIAAVVARAIAINPQERHCSAEQFGLDLAAAAVRTFGASWTDSAMVSLSLEGPLRSASRGDLAG